MSDCWPKVWGTNTEIYQNDLSSINILRVKKGGNCSWHSHKFKYNIFFVVSGKLEIQTDIGNSVLVEDQNFMISPGTKHLFRALEDTVAMEIMFVKYDHQDINREKVGFIEEVKNG
jgi:quercetin dioxygenase-like cupin family protein